MQDITGGGSEKPDEPGRKFQDYVFIKLTADTGAHIVAQPYNGQNALYAGVGTGSDGQLRRK